MKIKAIIFLAIFSLTITPSYANISITCSLFPVYDFAREIAGDLAECKLLLKPGIEPHEYEPSPLDIKALNDSDVFIFTGSNMEHWAQRISATLKDTAIIDASDGIETYNGDPHIWLDLSRAQGMVQNIARGLCSADPEHSGIYMHNAEMYCSRLAELDAKFTALNHDNALVFGGEFSCGYFVRRYNFEYISAYEGENEPSIRRLAEVLKYIREHGTKYIFAEPFSISSITRSISEQTGADILTFDTAHIISNDNRTFIQIMDGNYSNIARALND